MRGMQVRRIHLLLHGRGAYEFGADYFCSGRSGACPFSRITLSRFERIGFADREHDRINL